MLAPHRFKSEINLESLRGLAPLKSIFDAEEKRQVDTRKTAAKALADLEKVRAEEFAADLTATEAAFAKMETAKAALHSASDVLTQCLAHRAGHAATYERARSILEQQLIDSASPAIDEFVDAMRSLWAATLKPPEVLRSQGATVSVPKLSDIGVRKTQSSRWQALAALPTDAFDSHVERAKNRAAA